MSTEAPGVDIGAQLNGRAPVQSADDIMSSSTARSRPVRREPVEPQFVPKTPAAPIVATPIAPRELEAPAPVVQQPIPIAAQPLVEQPPVAKKEVASRRKKRKPDAEPGRKQTFAINETNDLMLEQAAFHTRKSKTYFVNKGLKLLLKQYPEALIPIPDDEDEEDDE